MIATFAATVVALTVVAIKQKINLISTGYFFMGRRYFHIDNVLVYFLKSAQ